MTLKILNRFLILVIIHFSFITNGQEIILEFNTDYDAGPSSIDNSFSLVNENNNDFTVFLTNKSNLSAFNYNSSFELQGWLASRQLLNKYKLPLGGTVSNKKYSLFYSNNTNSKFALVTFDFEKMSSFASEIELNLKKEIYLTQFVFKNKFHFLTTTYRENKLYIYSFNNAGEYEKTTIDLNKYDFYGPSKYPTRLKSALGLDIHNDNLTKLITVQEGIPYSLDSMVSLVKLFLIEDSFYLVSDINKEYTQIITYNLINGEIKTEIIEQASSELEKSNSFLTKQNLFQIAVNTKTLNVKITDIKTKEVMKQYEISKKDSLYFANGPIRQRGGRYTKYRELEKTSQFLRKVGNGSPAIYVNEKENQYEISIGSVDDIEDGLIAAIAYLNPVTAVATFGALTVYANPVALAMIKASNSKAVYINNILDSEFKLTNQEEKDNIFYIINDYIKKKDLKRYAASDIFIYQDSYLFGMLDKKTKMYILRKF